MKKIYQLAHRLIEEDKFENKYPEYNPDDGKVHVLYLTAYLSGQGLYRQILPAMELNKTSTHCAIVNSLLPFSQNWRNQEFEITINDRMILWADYIVFSATMNDISKEIAMLLSINKKPHLQFVMDIDDLSHNLPFMHPSYSVTTNKMKDQLLLNMNKMDLIIGTNPRLLSEYDKLLSAKHPRQKNEKPHELFMLPNLISDFCYKGIEIHAVDTSRSATNSKVRIGLTLNNTQFSDINPLRNVFKEINRRYKDKVELIVFGWNGRIPGTFKNSLHRVQYTYIPSVEVGQYFKVLHSLKLDIALMPLADNPFNLCKSHHKLLQYSYFGIPAIVSNIPTYTDVINNEDIMLEGRKIRKDVHINAMVVDKKSDWLDMIDDLVNNPKKRLQMGAKSRECVEAYYKHDDNIKIWQSCFR